jgi:hypothetical protein
MSVDHRRCGNRSAIQFGVVQCRSYQQYHSAYKPITKDTSPTRIAGSSNKLHADVLYEVFHVFHVAAAACGDRPLTELTYCDHYSMLR